MNASQLNKENDTKNSWMSLETSKIKLAAETVQKQTNKKRHIQTSAQTKRQRKGKPRHKQK